MAAFVLTGMFTACKKEQVSSRDATIVGKWYLKDYRTRSFRNKLLVRDTSRRDFKANDFELFSDDGTGYTSNNTPAGETAIIQYNYTFSGERLMISRNTPAFYAGTYTVTLLTADSLKVTYESNVTVAGDYYQGIDDVTFSRRWVLPNLAAVNRCIRYWITCVNNSESGVRSRREPA